MQAKYTAEEMSAFAAYFASGKGVTKLKPCHPFLSGAVPRESLDAVGEDNGRMAWNSRTNGSGESNAASRNEARREAAAIDKAKKARGKTAGRDALKAQANSMFAKHVERSQVKLRRVLRCIGGEWTKENIAKAALQENMSADSMRKWLSNHGHGDKLPDRRPNYPKERLSAERIAERNKAIKADSASGMGLKDLSDKYGIGRRNISLILSK